MNDLEKYFTENPGNLIHKWQHYFEIYDRHFARFRGSDVHVVEFGVSHGGSLQMWKHYFGPDARVFGIDIDPHCLKLAEEQIEIIIGDQEDRRFLRSLAQKIPRIDILIDDGGHTMEQQVSTYEELFSHVDENGVYLCEDLHTSYWPGYGGGYKKRGTFVEKSKDFIDAINAWHAAPACGLNVTGFTRTVHSLHYYDSVLVIEKRPIEKPFHLQTGTPTIPNPVPPRRSLAKRLRGRLKREIDRRRGRRGPAAAGVRSGGDRTAVDGPVIEEYVPLNMTRPARILDVASAWKGLERIIEDLLDRNDVGRDRCIEFGVEFGYSAVALSNFFREVVGVDTFVGDAHTAHQGDHYDATRARLAAYPNIRLVRSDFRDFIEGNESRFDLAHIDIVHTYDETYECGLWAALHSDIVIFHDTESFPEVRRAVMAIAETTGHVLSNYPRCHGLGILIDSRGEDVSGSPE